MIDSHPLSERIPAMTEGTEYFTCFGEFNVSLYPSELQGYWFCELSDVRLSYQEVTKRPVRADDVWPYLLRWRVPSDAVWSARPAANKKPLGWATRPVRSRERKKVGHVYFIQGEDGGPIKIGFAALSAESRMEEIQAMCPYRLCVLASMPGDVSVEKQLHKAFAAHRLHGEWFSPTSEILRFVKEINHGQSSAGDTLIDTSATH